MTDMNDQPFPNTEPILRPNETRAKNAQFTLQVILLLEVISLISNYLEYNTPTNDGRQEIIGLVFFVAAISMTVAFIKWFRRAYYNLGQLDKHLSYQQKDTGIVWFIPIMNLYRPYQMMREMYRKTRELLDDHGLASDSRHHMRTLNIWWILGIISSVLIVIFASLPIQTDTFDGSRSLIALDMVFNVIGIPLALLAIRVVRNYAQVEPLLENIATQRTVDDTNLPEPDEEGK